MLKVALGWSKSWSQLQVWSSSSANRLCSAAVIRERRMSFLSCCKLTVISTCTGLRRSHSRNFDSLHGAMSACMSALHMAASIVKCRFRPFYLQLRANIHTTQVRSALIAEYTPLSPLPLSQLWYAGTLTSLFCQTPLLHLLPFTHNLLAAGHSAVSDGRRLVCGLIRRHQWAFWQFLTLPRCSCPSMRTAKVSNPVLFSGASPAGLHEV